MNRILKIGIVLLAILSCMVIVSAIDYSTRYNPFTGKLDFVWDGIDIFGSYNSSKINQTSLINQSGILGINYPYLLNVTNGTIYNRTNVEFGYVNVSKKNITDIDCLIFRTGGTICTGN